MKKTLLFLALGFSIISLNGCAVAELLGEGAVGDAAVGSAAFEAGEASLGIEGGASAVRAIESLGLSGESTSLENFRIVQGSNSARIFLEANGERNYLGRFISENEAEWKSGGSTTFPVNRLYTAKRAMNIRSTASIGENIIGQLNYQEPVITKGEVGNFTHVVFKNGRQGYVWTEYLSKVEGFTASEAGVVNRNYSGSLPIPIIVDSPQRQQPRRHYANEGYVQPYTNQLPPQTSPTPVTHNNTNYGGNTQNTNNSSGWTNSSPTFQATDDNRQTNSATQNPSFVATDEYGRPLSSNNIQTTLYRNPDGSISRVDVDPQSGITTITTTSGNSSSTVTTNSGGTVNVTTNGMTRTYSPPPPVYRQTEPRPVPQGYYVACDYCRGYGFIQRGYQRFCCPKCHGARRLWVQPRMRDY